MRKFLFFALLIGSISYAQVTTYSVGDVVDNFTVTDTQGVEHNLYDITASGKYVFLDFFFTRCPPCQQTQQYFNNLHDKYGCNEGDLYTISISYDPYDTNDIIDQFEENFGGPFNHSPAVGPQGGGPAVVANFGISAYPTYCVIGPDNTLKVADIWPVSGLETFENAFPTGFEPEIMECSIMASFDEMEHTVNLYPTVSNGQMTLELSDSKNATISIFNLAGKNVFNNNYNSTSQIDLNLNLSSGVYIMKIQTSEYGIILKKFVIK